MQIATKKNGITSIVLTGLGAALIVGFILGPFYWVFVSSISTTAELLSKPPHWIPINPTFERYADILLNKSIAGSWAALPSPTSTLLRSTLNSLIVAVVTTAVCLIVGSLAAFSFARLRFRFQNKLLYLTIMFQMISPVSLIIPLYFLMRHLRLMDTLQVLVILHTSLNLSYVIWSLTGYFRMIPRELDDAAMIDGCSRIGVLWRIILPVCLPGLVGSGTLCFLLSWNEFMLALTFTNSAIAKTFPVVLSEFSTQHQVHYGMMCTGAVLGSILPVLLILFFQRFLIRGLLAGAVKG